MTRKRFAHDGHSVLTTGAPVLDSAIVSFDCELDQTIEIGTHSIFLARVVDVRSNGAPDGLIYFGRKYLSAGLTAS